MSDPRILLNTTAIQLEALRAQAAESRLTDMINNSSATIASVQSRSDQSTLLTSQGILSFHSSIISANTEAIAALQALDGIQNLSSSSISSQLGMLQTGQSAIVIGIAAEILRAQLAETNLAVSIASIHTDVSATSVSSSGVSESELTAEIARASAQELMLQSSIANEVSRAEQAESVINGNVSYVISALNGVTNSSSTAAVTKEVTRATLAESTEVTRATSAESDLGNAIVAEAARAVAQEGVLQLNIANEIGRAQQAEGLSNSGIAAIVATLSKMQADTTVTTAIANEVTRATSSEQTIAASVSVNATAIAQETTRASAAEGLLTTNIGKEASRAMGQEVGIARSVVAETTRATAAELAESTRAVAAENAIKATVAGISSSNSITGLLSQNGSVVLDTISNSDSTYVGILAGNNHNTSSHNTAVGQAALTLVSSSSGQNTAIGQGAMRSSTSGSFNSALGCNALYQNTSGSDNTCVGRNSLGGTTSQNDCTAIGHLAGQSSAQSQNTFVGSGTDGGSNSTNVTCIGYGAMCNSSNTIQLGNGSVTSVTTSGVITDANSQNTTLNGYWNGAFGGLGCAIRVVRAASLVTLSINPFNASPVNNGVAGLFSIQTPTWARPPSRVDCFAVVINNSIPVPGVVSILNGGVILIDTVGLNNWAGGLCGIVNIATASYLV